MDKKPAVTVKALKRADVTQELTEGVNKLLRIQHSKAYMGDASFMKDFLEHGKVVVACRDDEVVGVVMYMRSLLYTHTVGHIHNLIIKPGENTLWIGEYIFSTLMKSINPMPDRIVTSSWRQNSSTVEIYKFWGFEEEKNLRYVLKK